MRVHGGPHSLDMDRWYPDVLAHVDAGFLVAMVNYRGSDGFGQAWRDELTGNVGFLELEDELAGLDDLVARGLADPARVVLAGWSWGGYVTLLGLGRHPERWVAGIAGVPIADYIASYEDEAPILQSLDRALFGGSPETVPDLYRERNPITYADGVDVPLLILAGENDSRCPIRQVWNYVGRLRARGLEPEVYTYSTGHSSFDVDERVKQCAIALDFLARSVPGVERVDGLDAYVAAPGAVPPPDGQTYSTLRSAAIRSAQSARRAAKCPRRPWPAWRPALSRSARADRPARRARRRCRAIVARIRTPPTTRGSVLGRC